MGSIYKRRWKDTEGHVHESDVWWIKYYKDGKPIRESSESTKESDPRKLLNLREVLLPSATDAVKGIPVTPRINRIMFQELANDVINDYKMNRKRSLRDIETRLKLHILPVFSSRRASSITTADIRQYVVARQAAQASNAQINRELTAIKRAFNLGAQAGKILAAPHIPMLKENNVRKGFFDDTTSSAKAI